MVLPVSADNEPSMAVAVDSLLLASDGNGAVGIDLRFCLVGSLNKEQQVSVVPRLSCDSASVDFPAITVYGRWAYYHCVRRSYGTDLDSDALQYRDIEVHSFRPYRQTVGYEPWMSGATLTIRAERTDGCGRQLAREERMALRPTMLLERHVDEGWTDVKSSQLRGTAYVVFPVNRTEVLTDFRSNSRELNRLCRVIDSIRSSPNVQLNHIAMRGFASPEGSYDNNERLARERTYSLGRYVAEQCGLPIEIISMDYVPEDWDGLRRYVEQSQLKERQQLLDIIDADQSPDARLVALSRRYPRVYKQLSDDVFPLLRHTDYEIDYTLRSVTEYQGHVYTDTLYRLVLDTVAPLMSAETRRFQTFRPWVAVKSNLIYDLVVAPNIELEVPIGKRGRWSVMAEYCNPWWRWNRKSYSYEVQTAGCELRRWFKPRCDGGRPLLCGHFIGGYGSWAKYDLENRDVGDQGDVVSVGLTYGYAWPVGRRWNMEFSVSGGALWGERRHYNAEFESTHLIYKYTKNLFYAGPTKLKLSLVWLLGGKSGHAESRKGGCL